MSTELSQRAKQVLAAVIANYITTAEPVGSRTISKQGGVGVSPATIRNVMADLEEMGYLRQPHVSAGRVPTSMGLRFYVDSILRVRELDEQVKAQIRTALEARKIEDLGEVLKAASQALSNMSQQVAVVAAPNPEHEVFRQMEFILLDKGLILVVFVSKGGAVQNRIIQVEQNIKQEDLDKFTRYLNDLLAELTLTQVKDRVAQEMAREKIRFDVVLSRALSLGKRALEQGADGDLFIEGQTNLMGLPEFQDMTSLRRIFQAFEEKSTLLRLLEKTVNAQGLQIYMGPDNQLEGLEGLAVVSSTYGGEESALGALGIIGPTRMDYSKVIPIVDYTARLVSRILEEREGGG